MVEIHLDGEQALKSQVSFFVDGEKNLAREVRLEPGTNIVDFDVQFEEAGNHYVTARLENDDLPIDNLAYHAVEVKDVLPILMIEGKTHANPFKADGGLLALALNSNEQNDGRHLIQVDRKSFLDMDSIDIHTLQNYKAVLLCNVPSFSQYFQFLLEQYVSKGGGLFISLGDQIIPAEYNRMYNDKAGILPAKIGKLIHGKGAGFAPSFPAGQANFILDVFDLSRGKILHNVKVNSLWSSEPSQYSVQLARVGDSPFITYKKMGKGQVALWSSSVNTTWTNFPITPDFLPLMQNLVLSLSSTVRPPINLYQNEVLTFTSKKTSLSEQSKCKLITPDGKSHPLTLKYETGQWQADWHETDLPGTYTVQIEGEADKTYCVNLPKSEGNLVHLDGDDLNLIEDKVAAQFSDSTAELSQLMLSETGKKEGWQMILFIALGILMLESLLGWRFSK